jgi:hypothetical protein
MTWEQVAWLTWKQVYEHYIWPAIERAKPAPKSPEPSASSSGPMTLDEFKQLCWEAHSGWTEQQWREGYRRYLAEEGE